MKKFLTVVFILSAFSFSANSQENKHKDRLDGIQLEPRQRASIDSIRKVYDEKRKVVRQDASMDKEAKTVKIKELTKEQASQVDAILTAEQKKQIRMNRKKKSEG